MNNKWKIKMYIYSGMLVILFVVLLIGGGLLKQKALAVSVDDIWMAPCKAHILGTDSTGRDVFARLLCGGSLSLTIAFVVEVIAFPIGVAMGYFAVVFRGGAMGAVDYIMDIMFAFPTIILAMFLAGVLGNSISILILTIVLVEIPVFYIYTKRQVRLILNETFVEVLKNIGVSNRQIFVHHIIPHLMPLMVPKIIFNFATTIIFESTLSFIGIGVQPPTASWGNMISTGVEYIKNYPWLVLSTSVAFAITVYLLFGLGEAVEIFFAGGKSE